MKKVLVTGAGGFIGKNLCAMLDRDESIEVLRFTRKNTPKELERDVAAADFIFHLAGVNHSQNDTVIDKDNRELMETIIGYARKHSRKAPIVMTSSVEARAKTVYGQSKKAEEAALLAWSKESGSDVYIYRLHEVFGKWSKPQYNSIVATLCHNITHDEEPSIDNPKAVVTLNYIDNIVEEFLDLLAGGKEQNKSHLYNIKPVFKITLGEIVAKLKKMKAGREKLFVPNFENVFDSDLYATLTSYFKKDQIGYALDKKSDERGWLVEFIKSQQFGQIFISVTNPGYTRALPWHNTKVEKFLIIGGDAELKVRQLHSDKVQTFHVNGDDLRVLEMPIGHVHSVKNVGKTEMYLIIWSQQVFDKDHPDTHFQEI